jgi:hypothetical protein
LSDVLYRLLAAKQPGWLQLCRWKCEGMDFGVFPVYLPLFIRAAAGLSVDFDLLSDKVHKPILLNPRLA